VNLKRDDYKAWLIELKQKFQQTQLKAAVQVNVALLEFYWELGESIVEKQKTSDWGSGFLKQLSKDLMAEFPDVKGFSVRNLKYIRQWFLFYTSDKAIGQQPVAQLVQIPWGHNLKIIAKSKSTTEALYYVQQTQAHGWSRSVLTHQIESGLWQREGKAITNFESTLPAMQSDQPTIGMLLCKNKDRLVAEYALSDIQKPMGVSEYQLTQSLPENLQSQLPSIEAIEQELAGDL